MDRLALAGSILATLGALGLVIGLLLRFKIGRWVLALLLIGITILSLFDGGYSDLNSDPDTSAQKASKFLLIAGASCLALSLLIFSIHPW